MLHEHPRDVRVSEEIAREVEGMAHMRPRDIRLQLSQRAPMLTMGQVYYRGSRTYTAVYQMHADQLEFSHMLLHRVQQMQWRELCFTNSSDVKATAFATPFFDQLRSNTEEIYIDSTYKTNRPGYALYAIIASVDGVGYALAYLLLSTAMGINHARTN